MNVYTTELIAQNALTGELCKYSGARVYAPSQELAKEYCKIHFPYLKVLGRLSSEVTFREEIGWDWGNSVDYSLPSKN